MAEHQVGPTLAPRLFETGHNDFSHAGHRFLEARARVIPAVCPDVAIVNQNNIEPVQPHAKQRMLD